MRLWPWGRRREEDTYMAALRAFWDEMRDGGWVEWMYTAPTYDLVEITRREWSEPRLVKPSQIDPLTNVAGLYWRPLNDIIDITPSREPLMLVGDPRRHHPQARP